MVWWRTWAWRSQLFSVGDDFSSLSWLWSLALTLGRIFSERQYIRMQIFLAWWMQSDVKKVLHTRTDRKKVIRIVCFYYFIFSASTDGDVQQFPSFIWSASFYERFWEFNLWMHNMQIIAIYHVITEDRKQNCARGREMKGEWEKPANDSCTEQ